ncbi:MAG: hypothetical protein ABIQ49_14030 [Gemmatimonadales bacterium]
MDLLRWAVVLSATLAVAGAWSAAGAGGWSAYWPAPFMVAATAIGARDLGSLLGGAPTDLPVSALMLGIWAAAVVDVVGLVEIRFWRRGGTEGQGLAAPALLLAGGIVLLLREVASAPATAAGVASGILVLCAGILLTALRASIGPPAPGLRLLWPAAWLAGALVAPNAAPVDPLAEARQEMDFVLAGLRGGGARILRAGDADGSARFARGTVRAFLIDGNDVQIYLIPHDDDSSPEAHLSPRLAVPPPIGGVPHLHVGPHILVVCITADPRFARQLDKLVHDLGGHRRRGTFALEMSAPQ